jgi:hypothetical protein
VSNWDATGDGILLIDEQGSVTVQGHFQSRSSPVAVAAGAQAGTGAPAPALEAGCNDGAGAITFGTGTGPAAGEQVAVTFSKQWVIPGGGNPHIVVCPYNQATAAIGLLVPKNKITAAGFSVSAANAPAAGQANTVYAFSYIVMG